MTGWHDITVDGKPAMVRICFTAAWHDPDWRKANGLPEKPDRSRVNKTEARRQQRLDAPAQPEGEQ